MKNLSTILTALLILPIGYQLFSAYEAHLMRSRLALSHDFDYAVWQILSFILVDIIAIIVGIVLNLKGKYLVNSVMCATLLGAFLLTVMINFADRFLFLWLK